MQSVQEIQLAVVAEEQPAGVLDGSGDVFIAADEPKTTDEVTSVGADVVPPVMDIPRMKVEVVIDRKPESPVEQPILPDHYYDDGNVPVFKPVYPCSLSRWYLLS